MAYQNQLYLRLNPIKNGGILDERRSSEVGKAVGGSDSGSGGNQPGEDTLS